MRVAAIDIGSNSVRLLVADVYNDKVIPVETNLVTTRLGQGIGAKYLRTEAMERTRDAIQKFLSRARHMDSMNITAAATSAVRDAGNSNDFVDMIKNDLDLNVRIVSGSEEAMLTYTGIQSALEELLPPMAVMDLGGGSTEFIWPGKDGMRWKSVNVGAVRATEGEYSDEIILHDLSGVLTQVRNARPGVLIGVGGTITNLAAMALELKTYDSQKVHGYRLTRPKVKELLSLIHRIELSQREKIPGLQPARADIIEAGTRIVALVMNFLEVPFLQVSEADILFGLAREVAENVERNDGIVFQN